MAYNFDKIIDRSNTNSEKWNIKDGELPMWVADMDFETAPEITKALKNRTGHGVFGYSYVPDEWYDAYIKWWDRRYGFRMEKDSLIFCNGIIPAISSIVRKLTTPAEKIIIMTPVYNIFFNSILNNGRVPVECPLIYVQDDSRRDGFGHYDPEQKKHGRNDVSLNQHNDMKGHFEIDWEEFGKAAKDPQASMLIFCNPHNPTGTIWDKEILERVGRICADNGVIVVSDEIHCDLTAPGTKYIPFASVNDTNKRISVTCIAPSKTFNIAGLNSAAVYVNDRYLHHKVWRGLNTDEVAEPNAYAVQATVAAYNYCEQWLEELREYVDHNRNYICNYIEKNIPSLRYVSEDATYLCWVDARGLGEYTGFADFLREKTGLWITDGRVYGKAGEGYLRINAACPKSYVEDGMSRLKKGEKLWKTFQEKLHSNY